jgi:hypothetical protein
MEKSYNGSWCCCSNGVGLYAFTHAIKNGISGLHDAELERLQFSCQIAGKPAISTELLYIF